MIDVIILNWNSPQDTIRCIRSLRTAKDLCSDIIVVDNHSDDGSADKIAMDCPEAKLVRAESNLGYSGGNNLGLKHGNPAAPYALLLNNDSVIDPENLGRLTEALEEHSDIGAVGPVMKESNGRSEMMVAGGRDIATHLQTRIPLTAETTGLIDVDYVPGTIFLFRKSALGGEELLDERFFFSGEIADLCARLKARGMRSVVRTDAMAKHQMHAVPILRDALYVYYSIRNRFLFIRKHLPSRYPLLAARWSLVGLSLSADALFRGRTKRSKALFLGVVDGLRGRFGKRNDVLGLG